MNNCRISEADFFTNSAVDLAQKLLGKILVRKINGKITKFKIVETEAYIGAIDKACHAHPENKSRWKAKSLYNRGGHAYIYLIYGMYYCFNITSSIEGDPQGVLIRAIEPLENNKFHYHTNGPGKLCRALDIDINLNNADLITSDLIYLEDQPGVELEKITITKRINIDYAEEDKERLWRFYIKGNPFISKK
ncbi:MAG: DNA-3-methyladenine glycosylase [Spiroplasmataceae bacterium]|nr:DNA-3-methyladenine glycosylase [Spiroplasmataceae bacterium]